MKYFFSFVITALILSGYYGCSSDGKNNPVSFSELEMVIDKTVSASGGQQIIESDDNIRIIIPAGKLKSDIGIKVVRLGDIPKVTGIGLGLGNNAFKIKLNRSLDDDELIEIRIKYDESKIQQSDKLSDKIVGMIQDKRGVRMSDYEIDNTTKEIVISQAKPIEFKLLKKTDEFQSSDTDELIVIDSYSQLDKGQYNQEIVFPLWKYHLHFVGFFEKPDQNNPFKEFKADFTVENYQNSGVVWNDWKGSKFFTYAFTYTADKSYHGINAKGEVKIGSFGQADWLLKNLVIEQKSVNNSSTISESYKEETTITFREIRGVYSSEGDFMALSFSIGSFAPTGYGLNFDECIKSFSYEKYGYDNYGNQIYTQSNKLIKHDYNSMSVTFLPK